MTVATHATKARMWRKKHRSGNFTWVVQIGKKDDGKADNRNFPTEAEAVKFKDDWNARLVAKNTSGLADLSVVAQVEIRAALAKLDAYHATLPEAVDFFIKHARPDKGDITLEEGVQLFIKAKAASKKRPTYLNRCEHTFYAPFARAFPNRNVSSITEKDAQAYVDGHPQWSSYSKASHISYLRTFFNFFIKKGYTKLNPFANVEKPTAVSTIPKLINPDSTEKLLQFAMNNGRKPECALMTLVFFCGVRVEEVGRLTWADVDLNRRIIQIGHDQSKMRHRRVNPIPDNAYEWLNLCKSTGNVGPRNHEERMKRLRRKSGVEYPQNAMRHCFASYHLAMYRDASKTAVLLGHPNPSLLYRTYYELVTHESSKAYWNILPASVKADREAQAKAVQEAQDAQEREAAETQSNCGEAIKLDGKWVSVMKE